MISVSEASEVMGVCTQRVRKMIKLKRIPAVKVGKFWVINAGDLPINRKTGRPKKKPDNG